MTVKINLCRLDKITKTNSFSITITNLYCNLYCNQNSENKFYICVTLLSVRKER